MLPCMGAHDVSGETQPLSIGRAREITPRLSVQGRCSQGHQIIDVPEAAPTDPFLLNAQRHCQCVCGADAQPTALSNLRLADALAETDIHGTSSYQDNENYYHYYEAILPPQSRTFFQRPYRHPLMGESVMTPICMYLEFDKSCELQKKLQIAERKINGL